MVFDIVLLVLLGLFALAGKRKGLLLSVVGLISVGISYAASAILLPPLSEAFENTSLYDMLFEKVSGAIPENFESLPEVFRGSTREMVAQQATTIVANIIISVLIFIVVMLVVNMMANLLNSVLKLPGLNMLNKFGGLVFGTATGFLACYVIIAIWGVFTLFKLPQPLESSTLVRLMFENNLLILLVS